MVSTKSLLIAASAIGAMAIPILPPLNVSPGIDLKNGPGRFGQRKGGEFGVKAIPNPKYKPNGKHALHKVLSKYNLEIPSGLRDIVRRDDGTVEAKPGEYDIQYVCPVTIGGNQKLNLNFDTGSSDLWVFSNLMPKAQQTGHKVYAPGSSAKQIKGATWKIQYGDGSSASGTVVKDTVAIGNTVVQGQAVELAKTVSESFSSDSFADGLVGVLTADLRHQEAGSYDFGIIDNKKFTGQIQYTPIDNSNGFWEFNANSYTIGNTTRKDSATAIADTGTTLLLVSNKIAKEYYATVKGSKLDEQQGGYTIPCNAQLPDITIAVGSKKATVPGSLINYAPIEEGSKTCFGGIQGYDGNMYIYGDIFFKAFFSVFDYENEEFGFASKAH
ncbi:Type I transmembrane sorting receptor [Orbilia oligospora]|uniref:Type I transmembrane sorting receptor n=1 Tax=Orbilia oligospora TaxID=2813651 RepID=A0A7C8V3Z2_ORBOL|nr:Type I transmembrane sorting receptor [Orbilia oligospora]